jgi:hypothetical protein
MLRRLRQHKSDTHELRGEQGIPASASIVACEIAFMHRPPVITVTECTRVGLIVCRSCEHRGGRSCSFLVSLVVPCSLVLRSSSPHKGVRTYCKQGAISILNPCRGKAIEGSGPYTLRRFR